MLEQSKHPQLRRIVVLLLAFTVLAAYMPQAALLAYAASKASVYDGKTLKGSDGKPYYPNQKGGGYYYAKFSDKQTLFTPTEEKVLVRESLKPFSRR